MGELGKWLAGISWASAGLWQVAAGSAAGESCTELPATAAHAPAHATILFGVLSALPRPALHCLQQPL